jgi:transposase
MSTDVSLPVDPSLLPEDVALLKSLIAQLLEELRKRDGRIDDLQHRMDLLLRRLTGRTSERFDPRQLALFDGAAEEGATEEGATEEPPPELPSSSSSSASASSRAPKGSHGRRRLPDELKRVEIVHDLSPAEKESLGGEGNLELIGREVTEQLEWEPSSLYVLRHVQLKYRRREAMAPLHSAENASADPPPPLGSTSLGEANLASNLVASIIVMAPKPPSVIPGGLPGPGLVAHVATAKYVDHVPLNRQERQMARHGLLLSRQTTCDWVLAGAKLLMPLYELAKRLVLSSEVLHLDATSVKIRDAQKRLKRTGYFWPIVGDDLHPLVAFEYTTQQTRDGPATLLQGFHGYLQVDAHTIYDRLFADGRIVEVGCWMHARRGFFESREIDRLRAETALAYIGQLYTLEREIQEKLADSWRDLPREERHARIAALRQERACPVLKDLYGFVETQAPQLPPKNRLRQAMDYALRHRVALERYAQDGRLQIDNGAAERAIRGIALGRRNWLFCGSDRGAEAAVVYFTLAASCRRHGIDPFVYLRDLFTRLPVLLAETGGPPADDQLRPLLPDSWQPAR